MKNEKSLNCLIVKLLSLLIVNCQLSICASRIIFCHNVNNA